MQYHLKTPISKEDIKKLNVGDIVYLSGNICTGRDEAHITAIEEEKPPVDLKNGVIYHAGPIMKQKKTETGKTTDEWECVAIGPTTSARMNKTEKKFIEITNISAIIGKGGMSDDLLSVFEEHSVVYLSAPGGCAALLAESVKKVESVHKLNLGIPEAFWSLKVEEFGPLVVSMDSHCQSLYKNVNKNVEKNLKEIKELI
ncbi:FumA C-terminus/TtdB family hydratase beta subunit [Methanococcus voltae]|uniref:Hydro-lyase, Fe-S type, tartrate/fumarate subfamily, beta subunit n=1 Tax=Methanococcus voltae (strain ATCC BAA-1334 / A3) TaxID=456320 RepID=D7DUG7_METV3|nr:FumA C-terminus/TtdB family hydratase beta subunit [Methanococcus voltae]MCS3900577.1 fumarate hydratase subunit beta [Methanococcus voltae]